MRKRKTENLKTIGVEEEIWEKLTALKHRLKLKSINDVIKYMLNSFEFMSPINIPITPNVRLDTEPQPRLISTIQNIQKTENTNTSVSVEERAHQLFARLCSELGREARFYTTFVVRRYKITEKDLLEYLLNLHDEIDCSEILV